MAEIYNILRDGLWVGISAIATFVMALATFTALLYQRHKDEKAEQREVCDRVLKPLMESIEETIGALETYVDFWYRWKWESIKKENSFFVARIPKKNYEEIERFHLRYKLLEYLSRQKRPQIVKIITESVCSVVNVPESAFEHVPMTSFQFTLGGKSFSRSFFALILKNSTLDDEIREIAKTERLPNANVENEKFPVPGRSRDVGRDEFEKISDIISVKVQKDTDLHGYILAWRSVYTEAQKLKMTLERFKH